MADLTDLTAGELAKGYRAKEFTALDVTRAHLKRIESENPCGSWGVSSRRGARKRRSERARTDRYPDGS